MSFQAELANAARWATAVADRLPEAQRPAVAAAWGALMDELDGLRSEGSKELATIAWRKETAMELAVALSHTPLDTPPKLAWMSPS